MDYSIDSFYDDNKKCWQVSVKGEIDIFNSDTLKKYLTKLIEGDAGDVNIDCSELEYIDSTGLGALVAILKKVKQDGYKMYLSNVKHGILKILKITDFDKIFIIESDGE